MQSYLPNQDLDKVGHFSLISLLLQGFSFHGGIMCSILPLQRNMLCGYIRKWEKD